MFYNIKIKSNGCEFCLESSDIDIAQREMDSYFADMLCASDEFRSQIKKVEITNKSVKSIEEIEKLANKNTVEQKKEDIKEDTVQKKLIDSDTINNQNAEEIKIEPEIEEIKAEAKIDSSKTDDNTVDINEDVIIQNQEDSSYDVNNFDPVLGSSVQEVIDSIKITSSKEDEIDNNTHRSIVLGADIFESQKPQIEYKQNTKETLSFQNNSQNEVLKFSAQKENKEVQFSSKVNNSEIVQIRDTHTATKYSNEIKLSSDLKIPDEGLQNDIVSLYSDDINTKFSDLNFKAESINTDTRINNEPIIQDNNQHVQKIEPVVSENIPAPEPEINEADKIQDVIELYQSDMPLQQEIKPDIQEQNIDFEIYQTKQQMTQENTEQKAEVMSDDNIINKETNYDAPAPQIESVQDENQNKTYGEELQLENSFDSFDDSDDNIDDLINMMQSEIDSLDISSSEEQNSQASTPVLSEILNESEKIPPVLSENNVSQTNSYQKKEADIQQTGPQLDFKLFLAGFICSELIDEFLICAYYIKHILRQDGFIMKFINSKLFQATGHIADMSVVDDLCSKNYLKTIETPEGNKYCITSDGERYFAEKFQG